MTKNNFIFVILFSRILLGGGSDFYDENDDFYQLDYHRPRDREIALHMQAKAVENQG